ncbi:MAG: hypothetical protein ABJA86_11940 [Nocardioidaceae bacterium]
MRTTLQIDEDVLEEARQIAAADRRTLGAVISELARRALQPVQARDDGGFPVFDVDANAPAITADDVARALDDE